MMTGSIRAADGQSSSDGRATHTRRAGVEWIARWTVTSAMAVLLVSGLLTAAQSWYLTDLKAYLAAATELAAGGNPYSVHLVERGLPYHYHHAPWFAAAFIPMTALPIEVVRIGWSATLIASSALALAPLVRRYGGASLPLAGLMIFLLLNVVAEGNVQPLILVSLVWGLERRWGPVAIGVAASLKITPILLALVYVGRGEWRRAVVAGSVAGVLVAPTFLYELTPQALATGGTGLFTTAPLVWGILVLGGVTAAVRLARTRYAWLAAATATIVALPRFLVFDATNLLAAVPDRGGRDSAGRRPAV